MASQDARLSKFEADFKLQQSEMTHKIDTVLKAITDRITGTLPSHTVKNPKLSTSPVLSAHSYPSEEPLCSTHIHGLINTITIHPKQQINSRDSMAKEEKKEREDDSKDTNTIAYIEERREMPLLERKHKCCCEDEYDRGCRKPSDLEDEFYRDTIELGPEYATVMDDEREVTDDALRNWEAQIDHLRRQEHEVSECKMVHTRKNDAHQKETSQIERISSLPEKPNLGSLSIPCSVDIFNINAIADLGASVNIMSKSMLKELSLAYPKKANIMVEMADKTREVSLGIKEDMKDLEKCEETKARAIIGEMINKLPEERFLRVSIDMDDLEGIIDYLEPTLYDGFIDYNDEAYKQKRNKLLGMPYIEPPPIIKEEAEITKYNLGAGKVFMKTKVLNIKGFPRTAPNMADTRAEIINDKNGSSEDLSNTKRKHWCKPIYQ
ncbi:ribonuclease H-like domain-containing protein [Tanacetum coccineum]